MFLVILLLMVLLSFSFKEGLEAEKKVGEIYNNYEKITAGFKDYNDKFISLAM